MASMELHHLKYRLIRLIESCPDERLLRRQLEAFQRAETDASYPWYAAEAVRATLDASERDVREGAVFAEVEVRRLMAGWSS
jgi:hypothetical protein